MKPIIGINLNIIRDSVLQANIRLDYSLAVQAAGGIPLFMPPMADEDLKILLSNMQGLIFTGGLDYSPSLYGEEKTSTVEVLDPIREEFDLRLIKLALQMDKLPILAICAGCQLLNIVLGGTLIQDIETEFPDSAIVHGKKPGCREGLVKHAIKIEPDSILAKLSEKTQLDISTSHHQAVKKLGKGLRAVAFADDGIIEGVELSDRPCVVGVQWHPERNCNNSKELFQNFVKQAAQFSPANRSFCEPQAQR